jgi:hypothetical protein
MGVRQQSKHELAAALQARDLQARKAEKGWLLDEFVVVTGYHRRHAVRLLRHGRFGDPRLGAIQGVPVASVAGMRRRSREHGCGGRRLTCRSRQWPGCGGGAAGAHGCLRP